MSSLCYIIGPCFLSVLHIVMSICYYQAPNLSLPAPDIPPLAPTDLFLKSVTLVKLLWYVPICIRNDDCKPGFSWQTQQLTSFPPG